MAWIELHQAVWTHRKTFELASILDLDETYAAAHLIRLWTWALDNAPEGDLSKLSDRAVAFGAGWRADAATFVSALIQAGWVNPDRRIHDWDEYALKLIERRKANAERMRAARASNVQNTERARVELPDRTGPDLTGPDRTSTPQPPPAEGENPPTPRKRGAGQQRGQRRRGGILDEVTEPLTPQDAALWDSAVIRAGQFINPALFDDLVTPLVPIGRAQDGGLRLRAPPAVAVAAQQRVGHIVTKCLQEVGDEAGSRATIVA